MMPVQSSDSSVWVCVDANAVIDYIRECTLQDLDMPPTGRRQEVLRESLGQVRHAFVAETAGMEALKNLEKDAVQKLGRRVAANVKDYEESLLHGYLCTVECLDSLDYVPTAREMYNLIRSDPNNQKHTSWKKKSMFVVDPVLGSDENNLRILYTAADYAQRHTVELWTHDMDFIMFVDEIKGAFGLDVVDSHRLNG